MRVAHESGECVLPDHASRYDFLLAQLFACLALRKQLQLSYRKLEAVLADTDWCQRLGMSGVPDHSPSNHQLTLANADGRFGSGEISSREIRQRFEMI